MKRIAKFEKVSYDIFKSFFESYHLDDEKIKKLYDSIILPKRATKGSAGYDFFSVIGINLKKNECIAVPTGIRVKMEDGWVLKCYPRSGMGFKYHMHLANTVGIIDSDYYNALNEGHIIIKIVNGDVDDLVIPQGKAFAQGIFLEYGITYDDDIEDVRVGGFGSTR